jgi:hypothetical protein
MLYTIGRSDALFSTRLAEFQFEWHGGRYELDQIQHGPILSGDATSMPRTISRTIDNPSPLQGPGLMSWLGDGVASPPARMRGTHRMTALAMLSGRGHGGR